MKHFLDRLYNCIYAHMHGYFWLPCYICGRKYGGHEKGKGTLMFNWYEGCSVCKNCVEEADRRNKEYIKNNPHPRIKMMYKTLGRTII